MNPETGSAPPDIACVGRSLHKRRKVVVARDASLLQELHHCSTLRLQRLEGRKQLIEHLLHNVCIHLRYLHFGKTTGASLHDGSDLTMRSPHKIRAKETIPVGADE